MLRNKRLVVADASMRAGQSQECFNSTMRGYTMPVFTFEKISSPQQRPPSEPGEKKPGGVIIQLLDRITDARTRRAMSRSVIARNERFPIKDPK
jgi:hypothetical protein